MKALSFSSLVGDKRALRILCLGAHCDDIEIGMGGTLLHLAKLRSDTHFTWVTFCSNDQRRSETEQCAQRLLGEQVETRFHQFRDGFLPYQGEAVKEAFENLKEFPRPDIIFTHHGGDAHQDHRKVSELTWNTFRNDLIFEYEIPKYDGDLGRPQVFVPVTEELAEKKGRILTEVYATQRSKQWFDRETIIGLMRLRGVECASPTRFAEAFFSRKLVLS